MAAVVIRRSAAFAIAAILALLGSVPNAQAIEVFDGRIQAHGFAEMQIRGLDRDFEEELDLAQWYNVDQRRNRGLTFLPDGWGPVRPCCRVMSASKGRYDCIYSEWLVGRAAERECLRQRLSRSLPLRLRDANDIGLRRCDRCQRASGSEPSVDRKANPPGSSGTRWAGPKQEVDRYAAHGPRPPSISDVKLYYHPGLVPGDPIYRRFLGIETELSGDRMRRIPSMTPEDPRDPKMAPGCIDNRRESGPSFASARAFPGFDTPSFDTKGA